MRTAITIATTSILFGLVACTVETQPGEEGVETTQAELGATPPIPPTPQVYCGSYTPQEEYKADFLKAWYIYVANKVSAQQIAAGLRRPVVVPLGKSQLVSHACAGKPGLVFYTPIGSTSSDYVWSRALEQCTDSSYQLTWSTSEAAVTVNVVAQKVETTNCSHPSFFWFVGEVSATDALGQDGLTVGAGNSHIAMALAGVNRVPENLNGFGNNRRMGMTTTSTGNGKRYTLNWDPGGGEGGGDPPPPNPGCWTCTEWCFPGWGCWLWCWPC